MDAEGPFVLRLLELLLRDQDRYGYEMISELERQSDHTFQMKEGTLYPVLKKLEAAGVTFEGADALDASLLTDPSEQALLRLLSAFPAEIAAAAEKYDPARITRYVIDIATAFHRFYNACRILEADPAVRQCRMALCLAVRSVIRNVLTMFKVTVPESM